MGASYKETLFMKKAFVFSALLLNVVGPVAASNNCHPIFQATPVKSPYNNMKRSVGQMIARLKDNSNLNPAQLENVFVGVVADSILPYWYGTAWDFNGTTQTPGVSTIACGYFVSTVLRDAGLRINRVKMGQASSEQLTYLLAEKKDVTLFYKKPLAALIEYLRQHGAGLYIIGLESHVGFILVDAAGYWFIHAKWFGEKAVVKEEVATSNVLYWSNYRMVAKISNSKKMLHAWLHGEAL